MPGARGAALHALLRVEEGKGYSNLVLDGTLADFPGDRRDRALATALFYGVLERRITLDYILGLFSKIPVSGLSPAVREILRMGIYQIRYMTKIPPSAAVNESVKLAKSAGEKKAAGFVNAVLRNLLRDPGRVRLPEAGGSPLRRLSVAYSCPEELIFLWEKSYGKSCAEKLLKSLLVRPDVFVRVNNTRLSEEQLLERLRGEGISAARVPWPDGALRLRQPGEIRGGACYRGGLLHVQDLSSQICCRLLDPQPGERIADVCAAPGGKTFTLAERMENRGAVFAFDRYPGRVGLIREGARRLGLSIVRAAVRDAAGPPEGLAGKFDRVLCDVPCSGLGVLRRKPEIRYNFLPAIDSLPDLQYRILCRSSGLVGEGGLLFYSTCTLNPGENERIAERFLRENRRFRPFPLRTCEMPGHAGDGPRGRLTLMPHVDGTDGFFIAAFQKGRS